MATTFTDAVDGEGDARDAAAVAGTIAPDAFVGVKFGGPLAAAYRREVIFYAITKQGGALFALWWVLTHPTGWVEWSAFALFYIINVFSVDICLHRYFTHRAFETSLAMRYVLGWWAMFGGYGSVQVWVADHRRHHARTDQPGDPHSPYFDGHGRPLTRWKGIRHAHLGWLYDDAITDFDVYGKGLREDPVMRFYHKTRLLWYVVSVLLLPAMWGFAFGGAEAMFGTIMVAGFLRMALALHALGAVNSFGHVFGSKRYEDAKGEARNNPFVSLVLLGEGWHNNHHAHPRAAFNGRTPAELDPAGWVIWLLERVGLVWDVQRVDKKAAAQSS